MRAFFRRGRASNGEAEPLTQNADANRPAGPLSGQRAAQPTIRGRGVQAVAPDDPFQLDSSLFEYTTHRSQHGEAFVAYRPLGHPMVLFSQVDGLPLASLHLRLTDRAPADAQAFIARRPDQGDAHFLGVINVDGQELELVMTNLTSDSVLMFDIGGEARAREDAYWEHTDASFWTGQHRNDRRLNRSNILWPMTPNTCSENHLHYQDHGERRHLVLRATTGGLVASAGGSAASPSESVTANNGGGFPLFVYPKTGSRAAERFRRTAWKCPEVIIVMGTPSLLNGDIREDHNIVIEPRARLPRSQLDPIEEACEAYGIRRDRLLQVTGIDEAFLRELPRDMVQEVIATQLERADLSAQDIQRESLTREEMLSQGVRRADVGAGRRLTNSGYHSLLVEKFEFELCSSPAVLTLGVRDGVQLCPGYDETVGDSNGLAARLDRLVVTRSEELLGGASDNEVFALSECVICMEGDPPPDIVLYQCGHRCVHQRCIEGARLRRCPLCRSLIIATLPLADQT